MNTVAIKFNNIGYSKLIIFSLSILLLTTLSLYFYLINASVLSVVERKNIERSISTVSSSVSVFETKYFTKINEMNIDLAISMGFKEKKNELFAVRKSADKKLFTLNN
jgi:Zn/Cd-binding protein ZinT